MAIYGLRLGWIAANLTETDVIKARAAEYVAAHEGAKETDCVAFPGSQGGIWIIVRCGGTSDGPSKVYEYHVNRFGGTEYSGPPKAARQIDRENDA